MRIRELERDHAWLIEASPSNTVFIFHGDEADQYPETMFVERLCDKEEVPLNWCLA